MIIDLRSDTFTKPTTGMLEAMMKAPVGDDVFGEDPSVNKLEAMTAEMFGMEAALYCPTGTMSNQVAIKAHTQPGDEVICDKNAHVYYYEGGGIAFNAGCSMRLLDGVRGKITAEQVLSAINPDDIHRPVSSLVCLENTTNRGGGACYELEEIKNIRTVCDDHGLKLHLDGARLFNALVKTGVDPKEYGKVFHSISVCLNKGLGCPMGSMLIGTKAFIKKARRIRKVFGGGMRQAGYMAACGIYALENHIDRLKVDHDHAMAVAKALEGKPFVEKINPVETNILIFDVAAHTNAKELVKRFSDIGIKVMDISPMQIRMVFHLDVSEEMVDKVIRGVEELGVRS
jgi:threonine aldolase